MCPFVCILCVCVHTGHKSGSVYMWDLSGEQPRLMLFAPSATGASGAGSLRAVTALAAAPEQGIVCTGHAKGEVRTWTARRYTVHSGPVLH